MRWVHAQRLIDALPQHTVTLSLERVSPHPLGACPQPMTVTATATHDYSADPYAYVTLTLREMPFTFEQLSSLYQQQQGAAVHRVPPQLVDRNTWWVTATAGPAIGGTVKKDDCVRQRWLRLVGALELAMRPGVGIMRSLPSAVFGALWRQTDASFVEGLERRMDRKYERWAARTRSGW